MYISLVSVMMIATLSVCKGHHEKNCNVFPKDLHIEVGSSVELVCQTSCSNGKFFWTLNNKNISESLSKTINSTHIALSLRNFTQSSATVECRSSYTDQILGGIIIKTFSKPENIACVLHVNDGWPHDFTCTWNHHMNSSQTINYTILHDSLNEICKSQVPKCASKDWNTVNSIFSHISNSTIIVRAKTAVWEVYSDPYTFNSLHIVKISPPTWTVITPSSDHLYVEWNPHCIQNNCHCQVKYYKTSSSNDKATKYLSRRPSHFSATTEDLESCIKYNISVRCAFNEALWSNWSQEITVLTKLNKRHIRLRLWRNVAKQGKNGKRNIHLMWKGIPSTCEEVLNYTIKQIPYGDNTTTGNYTYTSCGSSSCDVDVGQNTQKLYLIVSINDALLAEDSVYVPAVAQSLPQVFSIQTTTHEGVIQVSWNASEKTISSYIIDWTHDGNQYYWKETTSTNATLFGLLHRKPYNITVTPLFNDSTGHGSQANQICSSIAVPESVSVRDVEVNDRSAFMKWETKSQDTCSGVITYVIYYETQGRPQFNVTVNGNEDGVWLKDLKPNIQYSVIVEARGYNGTSMSKKTFFTTNKFDSKLIQTLSVCGGFLVILVLSLGLTCAIQWKKFNEKPVPNPRLSSVAKWLSQSHQKMEGFFQPITDQTENQVITDETQREQGAPLNPVCNGDKARNKKLMVCDPSISPSPESEPDERFSESQVLSSPEGSMVFSSSQSSPYRSQDSVEPLLPRVEETSKSDLESKKQEKTTQKSVYVSLNMFEQSDVR
ncbi:interleukin-31 receptor subunit alpha-like isoform X2 [Girardinichthys multiradiatus]|uniref:interleukin-31 receptor subunit alpha-like isoform X2 n=1 Tax=Girardinichthys multiradiatus TaxID=208333 RepID=UPI001FACDF07|nr:interleukin-31 receptor subunit alpha-like isoform X2 [Girardinichthys multiradiatus]